MSDAKGEKDMYEIAKKRDEIMEYLKHAKELEGNIYAAFDNGKTH